MCILAVDIGQSKSVCCLYEASKQVREFVTVRTRPEAFAELITCHKPSLVVIEICPAAGWIRDLCQGMGVKLLVANTSDDAWRWRGVKRKTDRDDAWKLARMAELGHIRPVHIPEPWVRQWRQLIHYRQRLVRSCTAIKNRIRAVLQMVNVELPAGRKGFSEEVRATLTGSESKRLEACGMEELWRGALRMDLDQLHVLERHLCRVEKQLDVYAGKQEAVGRLMKAPGVGPRTAELVVALLDDVHRFSRGKQVAAYAGLAPRKYQSGQMDRDGHISHAGDGQLRALLVQASWTGIHHNVGWMREVFDRVSGGNKKRRKKAVVAVARRLLIKLWAMLRDGSEWRDPVVAKDRGVGAARGVRRRVVPAV